jgi:hypothetical protein
LQAISERGVQLLLILDLGTRRARVVSVRSRPRFTPGNEPPVPIYIGGWVAAEATGKIGKIYLILRQRAGK